MQPMSAAVMSGRHKEVHVATIPVNFFRAEIEWTFEDLAEYARIMEDQITRLANAERIRLSRMSFCDEADESLYWEEYRWRFESTITHPEILLHNFVVVSHRSVAGQDLRKDM